MVALGFRKRLNTDIKAQRASVERSEAKRQAKRESQRFRQSVCWFDAKNGVWAEIEVRYGTITAVKWSFHQACPKRYIGSWCGSCAEAGEKLCLESGFVADGLYHCQKPPSLIHP